LRALASDGGDVAKAVLTILADSQEEEAVKAEPGVEPETGVDESDWSVYSGSAETPFCEALLDVDMDIDTEVSTVSRISLIV